MFPHQRLALPAVLCCMVLSMLHIGSAAMDWRPCDETERPVIPNSVILTPDPPVIGSPANFLIKASSGVAAAGGSIEINVSFGGIQIFSQTEDLCTKTACPVAEGPLDVLIVEDLPPIAPPGQYGLRVTARDPAGQELLCLDVDFELVLPTATQPRLQTKGLGTKKIGRTERMIS